MEQQFQLKWHGKLTLFEQDNLSAEDRGWWMRRIEKELKDRNEREKASMPNVRMPSKPRKSR